MDKLKFKRRERERYLETLVEKLGKVKESNEDDEEDDTFQEESKEKYFENEIHKTSLKMTESEMVKKKYGLILDMLKKVNSDQSLATT